MPLSIPYTLANGNTIDATELNANFQSVATYLDTTKLTASANLSTPYSLMTFPITVTGDLTGGSVVNRHIKVPAGVTLIPVSGQLAFDSIAAGAPTVTFQVTTAAGSVMTSPCSQTVVDTVDEKIAFTLTSIIPASTMTFTITNTSGGGNTATGITATLICKALLTA